MIEVTPNPAFSSGPAGKRLLLRKCCGGGPLNFDVRHALTVFGADNLGVFVCSHVFNRERPILSVSHADGDWQFLCGGPHNEDDLPHYVGISHLTERDHTLEQITDLAVGAVAERASIEHPWVRHA